jgi:hypothetical protein
MGISTKKCNFDPKLAHGKLKHFPSELLGGLDPGVHLDGSTAQNTPWFSQQRYVEFGSSGHLGDIWGIYG